MTCCAMRGTAALMALTSTAAAPAVSSVQAACSTSRRAWSIAMRASASLSRLPPRLTMGLPNATRLDARRHARSSAISARPISRMQWWTRPGPSRPWAISAARPGPAMMFDTGTRTPSRETSPWPSGSSYTPCAVSIRSTRTPGASIGTSTIECRR